MKFFLFNILLITSTAFSQGTYIVSGIVRESETKSPVSNVFIQVKNLRTGASSDKNGKFSLFVSTFPVDLIISHVSYETQFLTLHSSDIKNLEIHLAKVSHKIPEVIVAANKVVNLVEKKLYAVNDYEFMGNNILTLLFDYGYTQKNNPWLVLMNTNGDTICADPARKDGTFFKDCTGAIHLVDPVETHQIYFDSTQFSLVYPASTNEFFEIMKPCISNIKYYYYLDHFTNNNQVLSYYVANNKDSTYEKFRVITDLAGLKMLTSRNRFYAMGSSPVTEADLRFEQMCFFNPVYAPLFKIQNEILIFNFLDSKIEFYNETGQLVKELLIDFHKQSNWKEDVFVDDVSGRAYTLYLADGISTLKEIDLQTGKFVRSVKIPKFKYVNKIKVHDNKLYFLYRKSCSDDLSGLYRMEI